MTRPKLVHALAAIALASLTERFTVPLPVSKVAGAR